ncbi:MAG: cytochrome C, partial [Gemmatimonadota bacterium]
LDLGRHGGIHWWHIYSDNRIRYVAGDERRQKIVWVELTTPDGKVRTYTRKDGPELGSDAIARRARIMDCVDCHNRPTHSFPNPDRALDELLQARPTLRQLPFFKREAKRAISADYATHDAAVSAVRTAMLEFYAKQYPDLSRRSGDLIRQGADEAAQVCSRIVFPEMDTNWSTHADNLGHQESPGCWRCHDDEMTTPDGQHTIPQDCDTCHVFVAEDEPTPPTIASVITTG